MRKVGLCLGLAGLLAGVALAFWYVRNLPATPTSPPPSGSVPLPAAPEKIERPGLPNCYRVSPLLYRGAQPTDEGFQQLKHLGVKTVINLRSIHSDRTETAAAGLAYESICCNPLTQPEIEDVVQFLRIVRDPARGPFFVHCQHGMDRTGMLCAIYRVALCGWSKEDAIREWYEIGFHETVYASYVEFVRFLDIPAALQRAQTAP